MNKPRILVVDDDPKVSHLLALILHGCGRYEVFEEDRPYMALSVAAELQPNLILLDVDMPGKSGGELAAEFKARPKLANVPVLFVTSLVVARETGPACVERGGHYFLSKPVRPALLLQTVREMLQTGVPGAALV